MVETVKRPRGRPKKDQKTYPLHVLEGANNAEKMQTLFKDWFGCKRCDLALFRPGDDICFASGNPDAKIFLLGEAPGEEEERTSIPFVGPAGHLLNQMLAATSDDAGIQELYRWFHTTRRSQETARYFHEKVLEWREREFFTTNVVSCRPPENRQPIQVEVDACWERIYNMIYTIDPFIIITLGKTAFEALSRKKIEITQKHGLWDIQIPGRLGPVTYPVMAVLHPSYLLREADWGTPGGYFEKTVEDILQALRIYDTKRNKDWGIPVPIRHGLRG